MAISFPQNATLNDTYTYNSITWTYNGTAWTKASASAGGGASITVSTTAPASPTAGSTWLKDDTGDLYVYGPGGWVLTSAPAFSGSYNDLTDKPTITSVSPSAISDQTNTSTGYFDLPAGTTAQRPVTATEGATRINTTTNYLEIYYNGGWVNLQYLGLMSATYTGATATTVGNYRILTYTTSGTFSVASAPIGSTIQYLVVAGGGGGGMDFGGGGGGGGVIAVDAAAVTENTTYNITVGAGGAGGANASTNAVNGSNSSIVGTGLSSIAIGGGGGRSAGASGAAGTGGSGGGAHGNGTNTNYGLGTTGQGYRGGGSSGGSSSGNSPTGGGGGGAGAQGTDSTVSIGGSGGIGILSNITGQYYAGGGGAGGYSGYGTQATVGGNGGGGAGTGATNTGGASATVNTGGGGGGGGGGGAGGPSGSGGSGIVLIKYRFQ